MRYIWQHIHTIIATYNSSLPLTHFLRHYYKQYPKLGSRDRKMLSEMAYCWYRCSKGFEASLPFEEKLKACLYLCETGNKHLIQFLPNEWQEHIQQPYADKLETWREIGFAFDISSIDDNSIELSTGIDHAAWQYTMLAQPLFFIRIRKNKEKALAMLHEQGISYQENSNCIGLKNGTGIENILPADWYVVQDASSQQTGAYLHPQPGEHWWDCCSGAGGKSLLLKDKEPGVQLTVSDKRTSILHNLSERFRQYGYTPPQQLVLDIADKQAVAKTLDSTTFHHIICDVPCTGSGTWARTPEQLYFFDKKSISAISALQTSIAVNASAALKTGGSLFYITCSVFSEENERVVEAVMQQTGMQLKEMTLINGIGQQADSMFIAVLQKH